MNIIVHMPKGSENINQMKNTIALEHIKAVTSCLSNSKISKGQKSKLIDEMIHNLKEERN